MCSFGSRTQPQKSSFFFPQSTVLPSTQVKTLPYRQGVRTEFDFLTLSVLNALSQRLVVPFNKLGFSGNHYLFPPSLLQFKGGIC